MIYNNCCSHFPLTKLSLLIAAALMLTGCVVGPDYCKPDTPVPDRWHQPIEEVNYGSCDDLSHWWTIFNDPCLTELVECSDDGNLDLYAALQRIKQAEAQVCIADSEKRLQVNKTGAYRRSQQSVNSFGAGGFAFALNAINLWSSGLDISWEPDVFGRIQRQVESAYATEAATVEDYRGVMVTLYAEVATAYVRVRTTQAQLKFAEQNVDLQERSLDLAKKRVQGGVAPILDEYQADSNLEATRATIPPLQAQLHVDLNRLAVLLGRYPGTLHECLATPAPIPNAIGALPMLVPCDVVRQRPDIRRAERLVAAKCADIGVAEADLLPRFSVGGNFGLQSQRLDNIFSSDSVTYNLGPSFSWPLLAGGRIWCNIDRVDAALEESIAVYEQTVLRGMEEVENAIVLYQKEKARREGLIKTVQALEKALESVLKTYRAGKTDFLNVLVSQQALFNVQNELAISEGQVVVFLVTIYRALGGGWDEYHHCEERELRLQCPERSDAGSVEKIQVDSPADRYFEIPTQDSDKAKDDNQQAIQDKRSAEDTSADFKKPDEPKLLIEARDALELPERKKSPFKNDELEGDDELLDSVLQKKVDELEQRLKRPAAQDEPQNR